MYKMSARESNRMGISEAARPCGKTVSSTKLSAGTPSRPTSAAAARWRQLGGSGNLRAYALGLESGMVGFLVSGAFFNQLFAFWFYALIITCTMLYSMVVTNVSQAPQRPPRRPARVALRPAH